MRCFYLYSLGVYLFRGYAESVKNEHCLATQISSRVFDFNSVDLVTEDHWEVNDFRIVNKNSGKVVFENGKEQKGIKNEYGLCSLYTLLSAL